MSTTLMMMSSIMMRNTTTFWVSGGRLQRSIVLNNPILCLLHLPEPLPRAISSLASASSSSSAPPPLPRRLSLSAEPPHHTAPPRPPPRLSPSLSSSVALLFLSALAVASSAFPATLPMPSVAPACQWRLDAYLCQRLCESAHCGAICVLRAEHPPSSFTPLLLYEKQAPPLFFFSLSSTSIVSLLLSDLLFSLSVRMKDGGEDAACSISSSCSCLLFSLLACIPFPGCSSLTPAYIRLVVSTSQTIRPFVLSLYLDVSPPFSSVKSSC